MIIYDFYNILGADLWYSLSHGIQGDVHSAFVSTQHPTFTIKFTVKFTIKPRVPHDRRETIMPGTAASTPTQSPSHASGDKRFKRLDVAMKRSQYSADSLIEILHGAQEAFGFLELDVLQYVAQGLKLPLSQVYGVATFYHLFSLKPNGKHTCIICLGTACYVKGADKIIAALEAELGVKLGETTADGEVSLMSARCLGACGIAPANVYDGQVQGNQDAASTLAVVQTWQ